MTKSQEETQTPTRRSFLKLTGTAPLAAVATAAGAQSAAADETAPKSSGLQDTAHTRTYYDLARF